MQEKLECGIRDIAPDAVIFGLGMRGLTGSPRTCPSPQARLGELALKLRIRKRMQMGEDPSRAIRGPSPWGEGQGEGSELLQAAEYHLLRRARQERRGFC